MAGFITEPLHDHPGLEDWVCIEDFCGRWTGGPTSDVCNWAAWWSPSRKLTVFCGQWALVQPMPIAHEPSEEIIWNWIEKDPCHWSRRYRAWKNRTREREENAARDETHFKKIGYNYAYLTLRNTDGSIQKLESCVGIRGTLQVMRDIRGGLAMEGRPNAVIVRLRVEVGVSEEEVHRRQSLVERRTKKAA